MLLIKEADWRNVALQHYKDVKGIEFECPSCKHKQSINSIMKNNSKLTEQEVRDFIAVNCEGRSTKGKGCDWTLGGLFQIHDVEVLKEDGSKYGVFNFSKKKVMADLEAYSIKNPTEEKEKLLDTGTLWICKKEFKVEPTSTSGDKPRKINVGEILEFRYPQGVNFRTVDDEYFYSNTGKFLMNCDYYGTILADIRFKNRHKLKQILEQNLYKNKLSESKSL